MPDFEYTAVFRNIACLFLNKIYTRTRMKVMKFGGTSVGDADALGRVKEIVESCPEDAVVVVSACSGITDLLLSTARAAASSDESYTEGFRRIADRHTQIIAGAVLPQNRDSVSRTVGGMLDELSKILNGVFLIGDLSDRTRDAIVSYGERLSSVIVSGAIRGARHLDARTVVKTQPYYGKHAVDQPLTQRLIRENLGQLNGITVMGGFIASDARTGDATNLGRGGSDYTASLVAAALGAEVLEIWTDVDGFLTADPKIISNPYLIERLTFVEAMELCNFGAKVIYPPTIFPVYHNDIPIQVKNTFNPSGEGTRISADAYGKQSERSKVIKGISSINDTALVTIRGLGMVGVIGINKRIFRALSDCGISVFFVSQASSENTTSIGMPNADAPRAVEVLSHEFAEEIRMGEINEIRTDGNLATVAIVGERMRHTPGVAGRLFDTLGRNGINVIACAQGASQTNISFVIELEHLKKAINVIHDSFFLWEYQVLNIFLAGVGTVGGSLLEQIRRQQPRFMAENKLQIRVVGISNSKRYITCREGIDLNDYAHLLESSQTVSSPEAFRDQILRMNIFNSVFVDCTASESIASLYRTLLEHNVSVVAANKIAASGSYDVYRQLKATARERGVKYLFETNVGAGLPIIKTINDLRGSGDSILKIEAVVSGTLNFIFNEMSESVPLSETIRRACEAGYAEPDPRIDLSGTDVIRKLVILSREAGYRIEQRDVKKNLFIPSEYFEGSTEDFWRRIGDLDAEFEARRKRLEQSGRKWRFVARMEGGKADVELREVDASSPFYQLDGSNNVILLTTERYREYPMQIKGYGAGADVTAAGVFADIISIANVR